MAGNDDARLKRQRHARSVPPRSTWRIHRRLPRTPPSPAFLTPASVGPS